MSEPNLQHDPKHINMSQQLGLTIVIITAASLWAIFHGRFQILKANKQTKPQQIQRVKKSNGHKNTGILQFWMPEPFPFRCSSMFTCLFFIFLWILLRLNDTWTWLETSTEKCLHVCECVKWIKKGWGVWGGGLVEGTDFNNYCFQLGLAETPTLAFSKDWEC